MFVVCLKPGIFLRVCDNSKMEGNLEKFVIVGLVLIGLLSCFFRNTGGWCRLLIRLGAGLNFNNLLEFSRGFMLRCGWLLELFLLVFFLFDPGGWHVSFNIVHCAQLLSFLGGRTGRSVRQNGRDVVSGAVLWIKQVFSALANIKFRWVVANSSGICGFSFYCLGGHFWKAWNKTSLHSPLARSCLSHELCLSRIACAWWDSQDAFVLFSWFASL